MGKLRDLSEGLLSGAKNPEEHHPFTPILALEEVAPRAAFVSSFANVLALDTDEGLVLVDVGSPMFSASACDLVRTFSERPLHTAIYTHGHVDHVFGVEQYGGNPRVVAHANVPTRFDRYKLTRGYNACINGRQFQIPPMFPGSFRYPDETYVGQTVLEIGGERIQLFHAKGETDDHTWVWVPGKKLLATGDLFIWAAPNCGNPQKVQRYPREWAAALRAMAALGAETMCPGHGVPIFGAEAVRRALTETALLLETLVEQTLALMNEGATLDRVLAEVKAPPELLERPYLRPIYDEPEFIVRNVWRLYGGWHDGNPSRLKPARDAAIAREIASLAGGAAVLAARAEALSVAGDDALACHLAEMAALASPGDAALVAIRKRVYAARGERETSLMARGIFASAAARED